MGFLIRLAMLPVAIGLMLASLVMVFFGILMVLVSLPFVILFGEMKINGRKIK